uniref:Uncharacterized protein n=1 Tax=Globisporangium ultimum (strain ATCC 200006 / CBS 805.95 / DAOM BR144) TaxID=431595 RepID=K3XAF8_GLOUD
MSQAATLLRMVVPQELLEHQGLLEQQPLHQHALVKDLERLQHHRRHANRHQLLLPSSTEPPQEIPSSPPVGSDATDGAGGTGAALGDAAGGQAGAVGSPSDTSGFAGNLNGNSQVGGASLGGTGGFGAANNQFGGGNGQFGGTPGGASGNNQFGAAPGGAGTGFGAMGQAGGNGFMGQGQFGTGNFGNGGGGGAQFGRNGGGLMNGQPQNRWRRRH